MGQFVVIYKQVYTAVDVCDISVAAFVDYCCQVLFQDLDVCFKLHPGKTDLYITQPVGFYSGIHLIQENQHLERSLLLKRKKLPSLAICK